MFRVQDDYKYFAFKASTPEDFRRLYNMVFNGTRAGQSTP
jgi:hypothetical protein